MLKTTINRNSRACDAAIQAYEMGDYHAIVAIPNARQHGLESTSLNGLEWHHAAGRKIMIFCKNEEEHQKALLLKKEAENAKKKALFTSKAGAWRYLNQYGSATDCGHGFIEYKEGKYGQFRCTYGAPDGIIYYPCPESAKQAEILL